MKIYNLHLGDFHSLQSSYVWFVPVESRGDDICFIIFSLCCHTVVYFVSKIRSCGMTGVPYFLLGMLGGTLKPYLLLGFSGVCKGMT